MFQPSKYDKVYPFSYIFTLFVTLPHSFLIQLAFPVQNAKFGVSALLCTDWGVGLACSELQYRVISLDFRKACSAAQVPHTCPLLLQNVYGAVPVTGWRDVSIVLMVCVLLQHTRLCPFSVQAAVIDPWLPWCAGDSSVGRVRPLHHSCPLYVGEAHTHTRQATVDSSAQQAPRGAVCGEPFSPAHCRVWQRLLWSPSNWASCVNRTAIVFQIPLHCHDNLTFGPLQWFIAILLPFYNIINAIMGALGNSMTAFAIPGAAHLWVFWRASARKEAVKPPS